MLRTTVRALTLTTIMGLLIWAGVLTLGLWADQIDAAPTYSEVHDG